MKKRLKIILSLYIVILTSPMITTACSPDCGDCRYWDGDSCEYEGDCVDDGDCDSCEDCVDCYCEIADGADCVDDDDCDDCEYCDYECECECATVSSISGISGSYCKGDSTTVTANLDYSASGCTIVWGGDASFSNQSGLTATATFNTTGENLKIWARTNCTPTYIKKYSSPFTVYELDSVTSDKASATLCEDIMFTAVTNPAGHGDDTQWSGGENPTPTGSGSTFTTSYTCIGQKTVTASLCDSNEPKNVTINLPSGCSEGQESVVFQIGDLLPVIETRCTTCAYTCPPDPIGDAVDVEIEAVYDNCTWVFDIVADVNVEIGICPDVIDISSGNDPDLDEYIYCDIVYYMLFVAGCYDCEGTGPFYTSYECALIHEYSHLEYYEDRLSDQAEYFSDNYLSYYDYPVEIDCSDSNTTTCQAVVNQYSSDITDDVKTAFNAAWVTTVNNSEDDAIEAAQDCFWDLAYEICSYADSQNWPECEYCPE